MNDHLNELWALMYSEIPKYVKLTESSIKLWFGTISLRYMSDTRLYFEIDNYLKKKFIEEHHLRGFCEAIKTVVGFEPNPILICTERDTFENQFAENWFKQKYPDVKLTSKL